MRAEKTLLLTDLKKKIDNSNAFFITRNLGVNPNADAGFRTELMKLGGEYEVVRKRIFVKAAIEAGIKLDDSTLEGHIGVVFSTQDAIQTTKAIFSFIKQCEEKLAVVGGHFEGQLCSGKDIETISQLPDQDGMRAQLLSVFEAPMAQMLSVVEAYLESVGAGMDTNVQEQNS